MKIPNIYAHFLAVSGLAIPQLKCPKNLLR